MRPQMGKRIVAQTYAYFAMDHELMYTKCKSPDIVYPRQILTFLLLEYKIYSRTGLAFFLGGVHLSTIKHSYNVIRERASVEADVQDDINNIIKLIDQL